MDFIRKALGLDADQKGAFTWIAIAISAIIVLVLIIYGIVGSFGVGASWNAIARASRWAGWGWKIPGLGVFLFMLWFDYKATTDRLNWRMSETVKAIIIIALIALLILVNIGFRFDHF